MKQTFFATSGSLLDQTTLFSGLHDQHKQQIASRLIDDFRVVYVEPLVPLGKGKSGYSAKNWDAPCGVHVFRPAGALPFGQKFNQVNEHFHSDGSSVLVPIQ